MGSQFPKSMIREEKILDMAWAYYQLHVERRLKFFSFFIAFLTVLVGGLSAILSAAQRNFLMYIWGAVISVLLVVCSLTFLKIDERNRTYRDIGRDVLRQIELLYFIDTTDYSDSLRVFTREQEQTRRLKKKSGSLFKTIFLAFACVGFLGIVLSFYGLFSSYK